MKAVIANSLNLSLIFSILFFYLNKKELGIFFILTSIMFAISSLFIISSKNKKIYFLILILICSLWYINGNVKKIIRQSHKDGVIQEQNQTDPTLIVDTLLEDIYTDINSGAANQAILDKAYIAISQAKILTTKDNPKTFINLGKTYEVAALVGIQGAADLAIKSYEEFCKIEPNNPDCYTTIAKFLILDKSRKGEALVLAKMALNLSRNQEETKNINDLIIYIESLK